MLWLLPAIAKTGFLKIYEDVSFGGEQKVH